MGSRKSVPIRGSRDEVGIGMSDCCMSCSPFCPLSCIHRLRNASQAELGPSCIWDLRSLNVAGAGLGVRQLGPTDGALIHVDRESELENDDFLKSWCIRS